MSLDLECLMSSMGDFGFAASRRPLNTVTAQSLLGGSAERHSLGFGRDGGGSLKTADSTVPPKLARSCFKNHAYHNAKIFQATKQPFFFLNRYESTNIRPFKRGPDTTRQ
jgi:hypothetical protein